MSPLIEGATIGALTGVVLLGLAACWFGFMTALVVSAVQFSGRDFFKIVGIIVGIGVIGGMVFGGVIGLLSRIIFENINGVFIGILAGAVTLCFGGVVTNFTDSSARRVQIERALVTGALGSIIGGVLGGILGSIVTFTIEAIR